MLVSRLPSDRKDEMSAGHVAKTLGFPCHNTQYYYLGFTHQNIAPLYSYKCQLFL